MTEAVSTPEAAFKDRKVGLVLFGVLLLLMALGFLGLAGLQLLFTLSTDLLPEEATFGSPGLHAVTAAFYVAMGAGVAWLGIGSIRCRRWARAVTLALNWIALAIGLLTIVYMLFLFRSMATAMGQELGENQAVAMIPLACASIIIAFLYVVLPGAFVLFYRSPHVKATCEHYDPVPRWTDPVPVPVLAGALVLASTVPIVLTPVMGTPMPFFGEVLTGGRAWLYALLDGGLAAVLLWGHLRRERWAWIGALAFIAANGLSACLTFLGDGLYRLYEAMQVPPQQLEQMEALGILGSMPWLILVSMIGMLGFWLWMGRYFPARPEGPA